MPGRDQLTNEQLKSLFKSNFELANYAMQKARYLVAAGHETSVETILLEILKNPTEYSMNELADLIEEAKTQPKVDNERHPSSDKK